MGVDTQTISKKDIVGERRTYHNAGELGTAGRLEEQVAGVDCIKGLV